MEMDKGREQAGYGGSLGTRVCICCGERMPPPSPGRKDNPNVCACCWSLEDSPEDDTSSAIRSTLADLRRGGASQKNKPVFTQIYSDLVR